MTRTTRWLLRICSIAAMAGALFLYFNHVPIVEWIQPNNFFTNWLILLAYIGGAQILFCALVIARVYPIWTHDWSSGGEEGREDVQGFLASMKVALKDSMVAFIIGNGCAFFMT